ncbi:Zn-dependent protease with chaperone function [Nonomuraea polychroma]|uniref:Zn-dependent protease with chaperone function n=1 Tax=Nonomuraea polychroma TaxID=46176 RepID=A0A438M198_9ACTN|nr:M48 family metallopeptidase [Nonomuraea polychroma]RVX39293.1 Zn-dependent protease with chaperone function [Nonomuraea polychroma]
MSLESSSPSGLSVGLARIASYALACLVHLLGPAFLIVGVYLLSRMTLFAFFVGVVAVGLAWLVRPRASRFPADIQSLTREEAPNLYALLDRIGAGVGAPRTDVVALGGMVNAEFSTYGWRSRRLLVIGYPLWLILTPQERVAVLAHEMAHSSNGDARHGLFVGSALHSLRELREMTRFDWHEDDGLVHLFAEALVALAGLPVRVLIFALELLLYRSSQRAEYRADEWGAHVAGSRAMASTLDALTTRVPSAENFLELSLIVAGASDLWDKLQASVAAVPDEELERRRQAAREQKSRVDRTHPPTYLRMERVRQLPYVEGRVGAAEVEKIQPELEQAAYRVAGTIRDAARSALYH